MHVMIIGAAGMIGRKLLAALAKQGEIGGRAIERITAVDIVTPELPAFSGQGEALSADLSSEGVADKLAAKRPDVIFHLAAIVSGEAEADFEKAALDLKAANILDWAKAHRLQILVG